MTKIVTIMEENADSQIILQPQKASRFPRAKLPSSAKKARDIIRKLGIALETQSDYIRLHPHFVKL